MELEKARTVLDSQEGHIWDRVGEGPYKESEKPLTTTTTTTESYIVIQNQDDNDTGT